MKRLLFLRNTFFTGFVASIILVGVAPSALAITSMFGFLLLVIGAQEIYEERKKYKRLEERRKRW